MDGFLIIFISLILYIFILILIRLLGLGRKRTNEYCTNSCPNCSYALSRIKRFHKDKILSYLTFRIFEFKRYICRECEWEGLRWERKFKTNN